MVKSAKILTVLLVLVMFGPAELTAAVGDPQVKTEHPWYPGELAFSTFERMFDFQAKLYKRTTGRGVSTDEDKALAAFYFRNLYYAHGEDGACDYFDAGVKKADKTREYWTGFFGHGFGLCGTTHAQWCAEMEYLLGPTTGRVIGVPGHNSFEVFLTGGAYGKGKWVLLDHDISTAIFHEDGSRLLSIDEVSKELGKYQNPKFKPDRQRGWLVAGLHPKDATIYKKVRTAEYLAGYEGAPPTVHLRAGETLRRYLQPGLEDGKTFVYWGRNYKAKGIPGPMRDRTWVNQPEKMYKSVKGTGWIPGQARFANAVYTYTPDFTNGSYKEGVVDESDKHVTFEFVSPYIVGCTPAELETPWGIYPPGAKNGLIVSGKKSVPLKISTDQGATWQDGGTLGEAVDLTDIAKGHQQYLLRLEADPKSLADSGLTIRTVCQCSSTIIPRLADGENTITYQAGGTAVLAAGPNSDQAKKFVVDGAWGSKTVTLEMAPPRGNRVKSIRAAAWQASGSPPRGDVVYHIDYSVDGGKTWKPVVKEQKILRRGYEPGDFWSQSFSFGKTDIEGDVTGPVRVKFHNTGGKGYRKVEAYLIYEVPQNGGTEVTFGYKNGAGGEVKTVSHTYKSAAGKADATWTFDAGKDVTTQWVEYKAK